MKELQNFVYRHMDALRHHKRYLAMLTALSMLVTFIVPLILIEPADSMTGVLVCKKVVHTHNAECYVGDTLICDIEEHIHTGECYKKVSLLSLKGDSSNESQYTEYNIPVPNAGSGEYNESTGRYEKADGNTVDGVTYNPAELPLYTLLFGEGVDWVNPELSLEDNLEIVDDEYFLGFASDFCAFIESDFTAFDADAEGRVFIGGDLIFKGTSEKGYWNYQVGAGDYGHFIPLTSTAEYKGISGFASGIIGGKVYRLGTLATGAKETVTELNHNLALPDKRPARHISGNDIYLYPEEGVYKRFVVGDVANSLHLDEDYEKYGDGISKDVQYSISCNHKYYDSDCTMCKNANLDTDTNAHSYLKEVNELSQFYQYNNVRELLEKTFDMLRARSLSLASVDAIDVKANGGKLVLDASNIGDAKTVYFRLDNWAEINNVEIIVPGNRVTTGTNRYASGTTITNLDLNIIVTCDDESIKIQKADTFVKVGGTSYPIHKTGNNDTNNHPVSSNILYNFYNATKVEFVDGANFNGTVFAPNANVTTPEKCPGHLSGALIAKSFYGGLEFGYRPYRGGVDIFGMTSGYAVPVNKIDENRAFLPGALFAIKEDGKFVSLFESGSGTNFAALPSRVDFTGSTLYKPEEVDQKDNQDRYYAGIEVPGEKLTAPVGFTLYYFDSQGQKQTIENNAKLPNVLTKFYLEANQNVDIEYNENINAVPNENKDLYTIYLIKPVESVTITAKNAADNTSTNKATVNFTPQMKLKVTSTEFEVNEEISFEVSDPPIGDTIHYKYFVNGNFIDLNKNQQDDDYITNINCNYIPTAAGDYVFSVKAYVKIGETYYEVESATAEKVTIKEAELPEDLKIVLSGNTFSNGTITSGNDLTVKLVTNEVLSDGTTVEYAFYNSGYQATNEGFRSFSTQNIVGKDLPVKVRVTLNNDKSVELYETITVNFKDDIKFNDYGTQYEVNSNDKFNFSLQNVPSGAIVTYYFNGNAYSSGEVPKTAVGENIPVYAIVSANGLEKRIDGSSVTGKYNDGLGIVISDGPYIADSNIDLKVQNAPNDNKAKVIFKVYDSYGNVVKTFDEQTVNNREAKVTYTPEKSGNYYFKAFMTYEGNSVKELTSGTITVAAKPVTGELSVTPNQANTGNNIELKVYGATIGANVVFTVRDQYWNAVKTFNGTVGDNGECIMTYTPDQAGNYTVYAVISKDGAERQVQQSLTINENTTALSGDFSVTTSGTTPGSSVSVNVNSANNGAVVNVYVTYPNGSTQHQSGNINNGTYNWSFNANDAGSYSIKVTLVQNGTTLELGEQKITISSGNDVSGDISVSSEAVTPNDDVYVNISNAPVGASVSFKFYYYGNLIDSSKSATVGDDGSCSVIFNPATVGNYQVEATINNNGSVKTVETSFKANATFKLDKSEYTAGETCIITVSEIGTQTIGSVQEFTIEEVAVSPYTVNGNTITFDTSEQYFGSTYNLYLRIQLSEGAVTEFRTQIINNAATNPTMLTLRSVYIGSDESPSPDNLIVIEALESERIDKVRLTFPDSANAKNNSFKLAVTFTEKTESEEKTYTKEYTKDNVAGENPAYIDILTSEIPGDVDIDKNNITKISITSVAGSIAVDKCYPTYVKAENQITKTYTKGFTLNPNEQKEIVIENWVRTLDSITFNLESDGIMYYALVGEDETETPVFIEAKSENNNKKIEITGINNDNIKKIKIYTKQESPLTVKDYIISSFVDELYANENDIKNNDRDVINYYTLVEQQAPAGYFKENTVYTIEVKETIKLDEVVQKNNLTYPSVVVTTISVKDKNGIVVLSYKLRASYTKTGSSINVNERKIEILGENDAVVDTFILTETDGVVIVKNGSDTVLDWDTSKPASHDYGDKKYYLNPAAMMIVPVPTPVEYTNKMGLLFRKIDTMGAAVKGVEIKLYKLINSETKLYEEVGSDMWYWDENSREYLIDFTKLTIDAVYKIKETYAGGKYELADEIYLKRTGEREVTYWLGSDEMPSEATTENQKTVLTFNANLETRVIRMENTRIPGIKISLKKTDMTGRILGNDTNFAKFCLYAYDGTEILHDIEVKNGQVELDFSNFKGDEKYVSDGYLMPGAYYLKETKAPDGYEASMKYFYFNVVKTDDGAFNIATSELFSDVLALEEVQPNGDSNKVIRFKSEALKRVSDGIAAGTINADTPIIQFKFKTDNGEIGSGNGEGFANAKFTAIINGKEIRYNSSKLPSGCINHNNGNGIFFRNESVTVQFTVRQLCELFNVSVENFNTIKEFVITSWNSTVVEDLEFLEIENPITGGGSSGDSGNTGSGEENEQEIFTTTETSLKIETAGLKLITDEMITNNTPILTFNVLTSSGEMNWGNGGFKGTYDGTELRKDTLKPSLENMKYSLSAKQMLQYIGVEISDSISNTDLITLFRKLTDFNVYTWNSSKISEPYFKGNDLDEEEVTTAATTSATTTTTTTTAAAESTTTEAIPMLSVDRNTIAIPNAPVGNKMNLRAEKRWRGDNGIPELRQPVEVQLMQKVGTGDYADYNPTGGESGKVTLNEANDWSYIWENLPRYVDDDETKDKYYYTIKELSAITGYEKPIISGGGINEGGTVVITNQAKTIDIPAEKIWNNPTEYTPIYPKTVKFKLQVDVNDDPEKEEWKDVPGKTLTITGNSSTWSGKFTGLIEGYQYKVVEVDVPYGWIPDYNDAKVNVPENVTESFEGKFTVTNKYDIDEGSIALAKLWEGENAARPYEIYLDLYRSVIAPSYTKTDAPYTDGKLTGNNDPDYKDDYMRLLQHSLYFYDANMCGTDVSTSSDLAWRTNCHTEDEILGGYHDAGDHVMFGLPQGYTASMLSWMYLEFFKGNVTQSEGNIENIVTDSEGNVTNNGTYMMNHYENDHFKVILDRFYDFFVNSVEYGDDGKIKKLLLQKGQGNIDHLIWCAPEIQKNRENEMIWSETQGSNIAAEYAAALALGYLNFKDTDSAKWEKYLKVAEDLYEFSGRTSSFIASDSEGTYYKETEEANPASDDRAWAAAWLYEATGKSENSPYKDARSNSPNQLQWDDVTFAAACAYARQTGDWANVINKIKTEFINNSDAKKKEFYYIHEWGTARFNAMAQTAVLITAKHLQQNPDKTHSYSENDTISYGELANSYVTWAEGQMDKILGNNNWKDTISTNGCVGGTVDDTNLPICLVTNFVPDGFDIDTPQNPHHRAASGLDSVNGDSNLEYKDSCEYDDDSYTLIGALVGGPAFKAHTDQAQMIGYDHKHPLTNHDYIDDLHDYCCNEVAIDYNAGLVGAAAGLYYFKGTGARSTMIEGVEFGSYGLKTIEGDIASPTKSAIPEVTQDYNVDPANDVAGAVLKTFAMRQTTISVMADSGSEKCYTLPEHIFADSERGDQNPGYTYTGNYRNVTEIQVDIPYDGNFGMQFIAKNGDEEIIKTGWMATNDSTNPKTYLSSIKFSNPTNITSLQFWNVQPWSGGEFKISEIRLYFEGFFITAPQEDIAIGEEIELSLEGNATITQDSWQVKSEDGGEATIEQRDGKWYLTGTKAGTVLVEATDSNGDKGNVTIRIHDMEITGEDEVEENTSITLEKAYVPDEAESFKWFLNDTEITGNTDEIQLNDDGTLTFTGKSLGERNFKLEAYDSNGEKITTAEKTIKVYRLETYTHTPDGDTLNEDNVISRTDPDNKYYVSLEQIPTKTRIQSITVNVNGKLKSNQIVHRTYVGGTTVNDSGKTDCDIAESGSIVWDTSSFSDEMPVGLKDSKYAFEIWYADDATTVEITSVEIVYRKYDDKDLVMSYVDANGNPISEIKQTIRNGESVYFTVAATGGTVDNIVLKNGETTIDNAINEADGKYTVQPQPAGDYTITATMDDYIRTLKFTVKDKITINGSEIMDLNGSQKLSVSNAIEGIEWSVTADENYTVEDGDVVTIKEKESGNIIATFNKSTGKVETFAYDGEFTITANDSYVGEGSMVSITINITERPKLPDLPKDIFLESFEKGDTIKLNASNNWKVSLGDLPMYDSKGNPYYYYIQESGYRQTEGGEYKPLTDQTGHFIYSTNASYMPSAYYNNGVAPDKDNAPDIVAKVKNKLHSKMQGQLPSTGGSGVTTYYYLGGVMMLLSIAGFTSLKRRERKRRKEE